MLLVRPVARSNWLRIYYSCAAQRRQASGSLSKWLLYAPTPQAMVTVPDSRLDALAKVEPSAKTLYSQIKLVDIAGLVKGASKGAGLGNQFLSNIRDVSVVLHAVRCFQDEDIIHVDGSVDPIRDLDTMNTELVLSDLEVAERRLDSSRRKAKKTQDAAGKDAAALVELLKGTVIPCLEEGMPASSLVAGLSEEELVLFETLGLITAKPTLYVAHVDEEDVAEGGNAHSERLRAHVEEELGGGSVLILSPKLEFSAASYALEAATAATESTASQEDENQLEYLEMFGVSQTGLSSVIQELQELLGLTVFYTVGPMEARAWSVNRGSTAPTCAAAIHSDFEKHFIRAETVNADAFIECGGSKEAASRGLLRSEGRAYVLQDGDVFNFLTSA